jgi:hypothetical protein
MIDPFTLKEKIINENLIDNTSFFYGLDPYYKWHRCTNNITVTNIPKYILDIPHGKYLVNVNNFIYTEEYKEYKDKDQKNFYNLELLLTKLPIDYEFTYFEIPDPSSNSINIVRSTVLCICEKYYEKKIKDNYPINFQKICYISSHYYSYYFDNNFNRNFNNTIISANNILVDKKIHWIWYRKQNSKFPKICGRRVYTWLFLNPEIKPILWTDINNKEELEDFLSDQDQIVYDLMISRINIIYKEELLNFIEESNYKEIKEIFLPLFDRWLPEDMMVKTDVVRCMILYKYGGFYSDFNDTICLIPLRYVFKRLDKLIIGSDTDKWDANNYFMYSPPMDKELLKILNIQLENAKHVLNFHHNAHNIIRPLFTEYKFLNVVKNGIIIDELCSFLKDSFLHEIANALDSFGIQRNLIEILVCHPEMFRKILQIYIWTLRQALEYWREEKEQLCLENLELEKLELEKFCKILEDSYCNTTNVSHKTTSCYFIDKKINTVWTGELENLDKLFDICDTYLNHSEKFRESFKKYFANNTQHVCMKYTNAGIIANTIGVDFIVFPNMYICRSLSLISAVCHIGTGSAAGDDSTISKESFF